MNYIILLLAIACMWIAGIGAFGLIGYTAFLAIRRIVRMVRANDTARIQRDRGAAKL